MSESGKTIGLNCCASNSVIHAVYFATIDAINARNCGITTIDVTLATTNFSAAHPKAKMATTVDAAEDALMEYCYGR